MNFRQPKPLPAALGALLAAALFALAGCATPAPTPVSRQLPAPQDAAQRAYLGLPAGATNFVLEDVQCEVLVLDLFDMYCHICQTLAPHVNALHDAARERGLDQRVKFIGLGVGDTPLEVATFKEKLKVPFPVFPDRKAALARQFGEFKLPNTLVLKRRDGQLQLIRRLTSVPRNAAEFFSLVLSNSPAPSSQWILPNEAVGQCKVGANGVGCRAPDRSAAPAAR